MKNSLKIATIFLACCATGWFTSSSKDEATMMMVEAAEVETASPPTITPHNNELCVSRFETLLPVDSDSFGSIPLLVHRNGEPEPCGDATVGDLLKELRESFDESGCPQEMDKYFFESMLTKSLYKILDDECESEEEYGNPDLGLLGYCDSGEDHTPILLDHDKLVEVELDGASSLPCHFHTREGLRVTNPQQLAELILNLDDEPDCEGDAETETCTMKGIHFYSVPAGRVFMFAPKFIGEIFHLPHVEGASEKPIHLQVISLEPRVFDVFNFFNREESKELVDKAIAEKSETHRIKRSTTGAGDKAVNSRRTSESGFDTNGETALKIKKRCFDALGFDEYIESHSDGLQILRYNVSKAYNSHLDWIEDRSGQLQHDYESYGTGGNRFATILLYMSDLGEKDGGETVFPYGEPVNVPEDQRISYEDALAQLKSSEQGDILKAGSWEEKLVATCRSKLAVRPHSARAVLFYSQHPNGEVDDDSTHGACPVLSNQKYAANLWVWNTPRSGFVGSPIKKKFQEEYGSPVVRDPRNNKVSGSFRNTGQNPEFDNAELFYEDQFWGKLGKGDNDLNVNTFEGHVWNIKVDGKVVKKIVIQAKKGFKQVFEV